jgi:5-methylcytosine-specific restriction endonuclease McrA
MLCRGKWMSKNLIGNKHTSWKGGKITKICLYCKKEFKTYLCFSKTGRGKYCSKKCSNKKTLFTTEKVGGNKAHSWKGGITPLNEKIRKSTIYKMWRKNIFKRDNYTCQICGEIGGRLNANHIKKFSDFVGLRFDVNNGITLCKKCHFSLVNRHEEEWESYFIFNLITREIVVFNPTHYNIII